MPKLGMEPIRKAALVKATISEIGRVGSLDVTVSQIAKRAGMSSALAHHYFGSQDEMFLAAMPHVLPIYGAEVRGALAVATGPAHRLPPRPAASRRAGHLPREGARPVAALPAPGPPAPAARRVPRPCQVGEGGRAPGGSRCGGPAGPVPRPPHRGDRACPAGRWSATWT